MTDTADRTTIPVAVVGVDRGGLVTVWSPGATALYEVAAKAAIGEPLTGLADFHRSSISYRDAFTAIGLGGYRTFHSLVTTRSGHELSLRSRATIAHGPNGVDELLVTSSPEPGPAAPSRSVGPAMRLLMGNPSLVNLFLDGEMAIGYVNAPVQAWSGYLPRDIVGAHALDFLHPDDVEPWLSSWDWALANPTRRRSVGFRVRDAHGVWRSVEGSLINMLGDPAVSAVVVSTRDVTDERQTERALAAARKTTQAILASSVEGVCVLDGTGEIVSVNDRMRSLLELRSRPSTAAGDESRPEAGAPVLDEGLSALIRGRAATARSGSHDRYEVAFFGTDGQPRWLRLSVVPSAELGGPGGCVVLCSEVVEHSSASSHPALGPLLGLADHSADHSAGQPGPIRAAATTSWDSAGLRRIGREHALPGTRDRGNGYRSPGVSARPPLSRLSQRELDVVIRLLLGDRVPTIAEKLFVSQSTVRNQLSSVFRKLGVGSQQELIALLRDKLTES